MAQFHFGEMYDFGEISPQNNKAAARWYELAAEQGFALAQKALGLMYEQGRGIVRNQVYAHMWTNLAVANGVYGAIAQSNSIAEKMTSDQIKKAHALARECMRKNYKGC